VGVGGKDPLVPHSDLENRWKNRRVEFILEKE
jgi:flagellar motor protein MotB